MNNLVTQNAKKFLDSIKDTGPLIGFDLGTKTIGVAISENPHTVEEVYEPFLIQKGYIQRTARGRIALEKAYDYLKIKKTDHLNLFKKKG